MSKYAFGDIAINSTEKKKPESADKAMYIGLEHLDSGCLTVRRFGADVAPIGDKLVMKKGDVLFGKRRAYQKKVAIAPIGTKIIKQYKGRDYVIRVLENGYELDGQRFKSLSGMAKKITGMKISGSAFFGFNLRGK